MRRALWSMALVGLACGEAAPVAPPANPDDDPIVIDDPSFDWQLPPGFPTPAVPADNPMSAAKVELGRHLFHDRRLSLDETQSCADCHQQALAFTDGRALGVGSTGAVHPRSSMSLTNIAYTSVLTWANPLLDSLEDQVVVPLFGDEPIELGFRGQEATLLERLRDEPRYGPLFTAAFPELTDPVTVASVARALAAFQRTIISGRSPYDRYLRDRDDDAISASARRGAALFGSEKLECFHCHGGFNFQDSIDYLGKSNPEARFHNTGLYNVGGTGAYPPGNTGVHAITGKPTDMGRFRAPTLRNIAVTAPYMHDGSIATLSEVLDHYAAGGRTLTEGPHAGVGSANPGKSSLIVGFDLSAQERADVLAFLESLTDEGLLTGARWSDPWAP